MDSPAHTRPHRWLCFIDPVRSAIDRTPESPLATQPGSVPVDLAVDSARKCRGSPRDHFSRATLAHPRHELRPWWHGRDSCNDGQPVRKIAQHVPHRNSHALDACKRRGVDQDASAFWKVVRNWRRASLRGSIHASSDRYDCDAILDSYHGGRALSDWEMFLLLAPWPAPSWGWSTGRKSGMAFGGEKAAV